jgi:hypothetical protein
LNSSKPPNENGPRAPQLDGAEGGAGPARLAQVRVDQREPIAPRPHRLKSHVHDLVTGHGDGAGGERLDAGQEAVLAGGARDGCGRGHGRHHSAAAWW